MADDRVPDPRSRAVLLRHLLSRASTSAGWSRPSRRRGPITGAMSPGRPARSRRALAETSARAASARDRARIGGVLGRASELTDAAVTALARRYDSARGGYGGAPKFPPSTVLEFLLRRSERTPGIGVADRALAMASGTLEAMARGGIYDQLGGGFARYSVDADWVVPHFEKMLYDNAQLARIYAHWWRRQAGLGRSGHRRRGGRRSGAGPPGRAADLRLDARRPRHRRGRLRQRARRGQRR